MAVYDLTPERWKAWSGGANQRASAYWQTIFASDPMLERAFVTVEIIAGGRTYLLARDTIQTTRGSTGEVMRYLPGLMSEPEVVQEVVIGAQQAAARSVSIQVPGWLIDPNAALATGQMLAGMAEIAVQVDGGDYDARLVLMRGSITGGASFGEDSETVTITVTDPRDLQGVKLPPWVVDSASWPLAQDAAVGERIPRVYNGASALPALRVRDDHGATGLWFAVCDTPDKFDIDALYVNGTAVAKADVTYGWAEQTQVDGLGRRTLVANASAGAGPWEERDAVNVDLSRASGVRAMGVLEVVRRLLSENTGLGLLGLNLDLISYGETRMPPTAPRVVINASGQDAAGALEYVESGLLPDYPMVHLAYAGAGLGAVVIDRRVGAGGAGATGELVGGQFPLYQRTTQYDERPKGELFTSFEVRYGYNPMDRSYAGIVRRDPSNAPACALARKIIGGDRPMGALESVTIGSAMEAGYVIDWLVAHHTVPFYAVEWACSPWVHFRYRVGENVVFTDPDFPAISGAVATVVRLGYARGGHFIGLLVWHPTLSTLSLSMTAGG